MLGPGEFRALVESFVRSALRLESRRYTDVEDERPELRAFLAGDLPEIYEWQPNDWAVMAARQRSMGRPIRRVRVMDDPLTDYNRYMIYTGRGNVTAGESIWYLARTEANRLDLPDHDFWIFDSERLVEMRFTEDGRSLGHDLITDPAIVARHEDWVHRALDAATPSVDYLAEDPTRAWPPVRLGAVKGT